MNEFDTTADRFRLDVLYGGIKLEEHLWTLQRVKPTGWLKWFKKDQAKLENNYLIIRGEYEHIKQLALNDPIISQELRIIK